MEKTPRQDLPARALRFSMALIQFQRRAAPIGPTAAHMALQMFRAGTAIGASIEEGQVANSRRDMAAKYAIALREARETAYWLKLLGQEESLSADAQRLAAEASEFVAMLTVSVRKLRQRDAAL
jgi:four helix bundle protein